MLATDRGRHLQTIVRACAALCAVLAVWLLLRLAWLLLPHAGTAASAPGAAPTTAPATAPGSIAGWHLFGQTPPRPGSAGAASTLDLILRGTLAGQRPDDGYAVIADAGGERTFRVGEEVQPGVRLAEVRPDRVVLDRGGTRETLVLPRDRNLAPADIVRPTPGRSGSRPATATATAPSPAARSGPSTSPQASTDWQRTVEQLRQNPAELLRRVQVVPEFDGGRMTGVRLAAIGDTELLSRLGLRPGDVVTAVDGSPVDSFARGQQIVAGLAKARSARVSVLRDGRPTEVTVSLP